MDESIDQGFQQEKSAFQAQLAALANEHKQALLMAFAERLHLDGAGGKKAPKRRWSFFQPTAAWLQQRFFAQGPQNIAPVGCETQPPLSDETEVIVIDGEYRVLEAPAKTEAAPAQKETIL